MVRPYNFGPGPAQMPEDILKTASDELLDFSNTGMSCMEMPHRGHDFKKIITRATENACELLNLPSTHKLLFMQGGARAQNAIIPMNLLNKSRVCDYVVTGYWSQKTAIEAAKYGIVNIASSTEGDFISIPPPSSWRIKNTTSYVHICSNETVHGVEFSKFPDLNSINRGHIPLIVDISSNILNRPMDFSNVGLAYASAQKNVGAAGLTIVIINESLLTDKKDRGLIICPSVFDYRNILKNNSMYNTPPTYSIYIAGLMFDWLIKKGGIEVIEQINIKKSQLIYDALDLSDFYQTPVQAPFRSKVNIPFFLPEDDLNDIFIEGAKKRGLLNLKGHPVLGGLRASIYNSMPIEGVQSLVSWLKEFENKYG